MSHALASGFASVEIAALDPSSHFVGGGASSRLERCSGQPLLKRPSLNFMGFDNVCLHLQLGDMPSKCSSPCPLEHSPFKVEDDPDSASLS